MLSLLISFVIGRLSVRALLLRKKVHNETYKSIVYKSFSWAVLRENGAELMGGSRRRNFPWAASVGWDILALLFNILY